MDETGEKGLHKLCRCEGERFLRVDAWVLDTHANHHDGTSQCRLSRLDTELLFGGDGAGVLAVELTAPRLALHGFGCVCLRPGECGLREIRGENGTKRKRKRKRKRKTKAAYIPMFRLFCRAFPRGYAP